MKYLYLSITMVLSITGIILISSWLADLWLSLAGSPQVDDATPPSQSGAEGSLAEAQGVKIYALRDIERHGLR
jgi:hypothetical protein